MNLNKWVETILLLNFKAAIITAVGFTVFYLFKSFLSKKTSVIDEHSVLKATLYALLILPILSWLSASLPISQNITNLVIFPTQEIDTAPSFAPVSLAVYFAGLYVAVSLAMVLLLWVRWNVVGHRIKQMSTAASSSEVQLLKTIKTELGINADVQLKFNGNSTPHVWGLFKPSIVVPADFESWTESLKKTVFTHELIHIKYKDQLILLLSHLCCFMFFINPLVWLLKIHISKTIEKTCDARVLNQGITVQEYSENLIAAVKSLAQPKFNTGYLCPMARNNELSDRIKNLLQKSTRRNKMSHKKLVSFISVLFAFFAVVAVLQTSQAQEINYGDKLVVKNSVTPTYPEEAKKMGQTGWVILEYDLNAQGEVKNARVVKAEPSYVFDWAALDSLNQWGYEPDPELMPVSGLRKKMTFLLDK